LTDYSKSTNFASKDSLPPGSALKVVRGTELDAEFNNLASSSSTKADKASPTFTGTVTVTGDETVSGNLGVAGTLSLTGTGAAVFNAGTTAQRPATPPLGSVRYNTTINKYEGFGSVNAAQSISSITFSTTTATLTTATAHGLSTGAVVVVSGTTPSTYSGTFVITVTSTTTFTYTMSANPGANASVVGIFGTGYWGALGGGATGSGSDSVFFENSQAVTANYTITSGKSAHSAGPITIASGVSVTIPSGSRWVIL